MNQLLLNTIASIIGVILGTAVGLILAYCASRIFGWDFKKIITPRLTLIILGTFIAFSLLHYILKSYGIAPKTLILFYAFIAILFGSLSIFVRRKKSKKH